MKKLLSGSFSLLFLLLFISNYASAQQWTDEQKEVWKSVETYNDLAVNRDAGFLNYFDDSYKGWEYTADAPQGKQDVKTMVAHRDPNVSIVYYTLTPAAIWVNGNFAFVHYYYSMLSENKEGKREFEKGRWTDILTKKDGKWIMIGDHGGAIPNK